MYLMESYMAIYEINIFENFVTELKFVNIKIKQSNRKIR